MFLLPVPELLKKTARKYIQGSWECALGSCSYKWSEYKQGILAVSPLCYKYPMHGLVVKCQSHTVKLLGQCSKLCQVCSSESNFPILLSEKLENVDVVGEG